MMDIFTCMEIEFECVRKRDAFGSASQTTPRSLHMASDHPKRPTDREVFPMTKGHSTESTSSSFERKTTSLWPLRTKSKLSGLKLLLQTLEIQIANIFLDTLVMHRTLTILLLCIVSAHRGL
ncbi:hypothetical protein L596_013019 [Steinernema carpocapsae]|uniref:Uncharacterized protein n=1 Tax=Steinernema carpocapsae TaxID=34508 RepID=A0A4U5NYZ4_STECR|nr:hypothetical protein L596_013019 [Steinernema carpocapsae]